jgi:hypothetical protein
MKSRIAVLLSFNAATVIDCVGWGWCGVIRIHGAWHGIAQGCHVAEQCRDRIRLNLHGWIRAMCSLLAAPFPFLLSDAKN